MRRDVGRHADRNALTAVDEQVREAGRQNMGFLFGFVKVGVPVHGVLFNVSEHLTGNFGHTGLGVTVGSRGVTVNGAEVALAVHERIAQTEILCKTNHRIVDRSITVRVIRTENGTDSVRGFAIRMARVIAALVHRVKDAAVYGLEAVPHIRQRARDNDRHGIVKERGFNLVLDIPHNDLRSRTGNHDNIFFHSHSPLFYRGFYHDIGQVSGCYKFILE